MPVASHAGFDILDLELTPVGDGLDLLEAKRIHRRFDRGSQKAKADHLASYFLFGEVGSGRLSFKDASALHLKPAFL